MQRINFLIDPYLECIYLQYFFYKDFWGREFFELTKSYRESSKF